MLRALPDDVVALIVQRCTRTCPDCASDARYPVCTIRACEQCGMHVCRHHAKARFALDAAVCNNCYFWAHGQPAAAYGSHW